MPLADIDLSGSNAGCENVSSLIAKKLEDWLTIYQEPVTQMKLSGADDESVPTWTGLPLASSRKYS